VARGIKQYGAAIRHNFKVRQNQGRKTDCRKHFITQQENITSGPESYLSKGVNSSLYRLSDSNFQASRSSAAIIGSGVQFDIGWHSFFILDHGLHFNISYVLPSPSIGTTKKTIQNEEKKIFDQAQQMQIEQDPIRDLEGYSLGTADWTLGIALS
jgi:hypothetical protein